MTDITVTAPIATRRPLRLEFPKLGIGAALDAFSKAIGQTLDLAYVAPYRSITQPPAAAINADLEGRDPHW